MTAELDRLANDPNFVVEFAVGDPFPTLVPQSRNSGLRLFGVYYHEPKRYVLKSAHVSREDLRIFDIDTGLVVLVSHHPGKNPYEAFDPLGLTNVDQYYQVDGGEWSSVCDVSARGDRFRSFKIRPKTWSRHGRQYVKVGDRVVMNVAKISMLKTMSLRDHFMVGRDTGDDIVYTCVADIMGRSVMIHNQEEQLVAVMAKTKKALMLTAVFGAGSESTIDIAPGVDCSVILAVVFAMSQVGAHYMSDAFKSYVSDPLKDAAIGTAVDGVGEAFSQIGEATNEESGGIEEHDEGEESQEEEEGEGDNVVGQAAQFVFENFFA